MAAAYSNEAFELWVELTSPEEYLDTALITQDVFCDALDRFRAAGVQAERERCFQWVIGRIPRSQAARSIRDGAPTEPSIAESPADPPG